MGKDAPRPPDAGDMARAQTIANREAIEAAARYGQMGETSPFGTLRYEGELGTPERERIIELTPEDQQRLDLQRQLGLAMSGFGLETVVPQMEGIIGAAPLGESDLLEGARGLEEATLERGMGMLAPRFEEQSRELDTMLQARGIPVGSLAYERERDRLERSQNTALENLALSSVGAGRAEQSRLLSADQARRSQAINELAAVMQGTPAIGTPQFAPAAQYGPMPVDAAGAMQVDYANQMARYNQQAGDIGGLYGLAGQVAGALPYGQWL